MTIEKKNGAKYSFLLKENPVITYQNGNIVINGNEKTSYSIEEVKNYHFSEENESAIDNVASTQILRIVSISEDVIRVENALTNTSTSTAQLSDRQKLMTKGQQTSLFQTRKVFMCCV